MSRSILISSASFIALMGCEAGEMQTDPVPAPGSQQTGIEDASIAAGLTGRTFDVTGELFGYFLPQDEIAIGSIELDHIWVEPVWRAEDGTDFPQVGLAFDDVSSPTGIGELGNTYYEVTYSVMPEIYSVTDTGLSFIGQHELLGEIRFEGRWNPEHVAEMMAANPQNAGEALTGDLKIGDVIFNDVTFQGWLGD
ncbi:hypothetical protein V0U79_08175 [Hyphobacterium sp. HN65]|uniref:Transferrin-binding protein B C-lobe/N-lobe beta barrel domain-containing protein n=1 Tax=Hyphobacterium lacteum TaxID=3116575 RepID=A0ABU7LQZ5_9PROT|nr:hypothetical protein [Hyphobacterium sp. HN65]MEE2526340.1 hypothetical protein [Hyphobacterium sp. HN65]